MERREKYYRYIKEELTSNLDGFLKYLAESYKIYVLFGLVKDYKQNQ